MKSFLALVVSGLAGLVAAQPQFTNSQIDPVPGSTFTLTWSNAQGPVTVKLKNGPSTNLKDVLTICSGVSGTSCTWSVPTNLPSDTYAFEIDDASGVPNYSTQFSYVGTGTPSVTGSTASSTAAASTSASASHSTTASTSASTTMSTTTTASTSASKTSSSATAASTTSVPGAANQLSSPLALILVTVAAMFYFH